METAGIEPASCSVQARGALPEHVPRLMFEAAAVAGFAGNGSSTTSRSYAMPTKSSWLREAEPDFVGECGRVESNHHSQRRRGYSALSSPMLSVRARGSRPDSNRYREAHNLGCSPLHHGHHEAGTTGLEPAASRLTSERSARLSYAPK
jgi:hypothetical protein